VQARGCVWEGASGSELLASRGARAKEGRRTSERTRAKRRGPAAPRCAPARA